MQTTENKEHYNVMTWENQRNQKFQGKNLEKIWPNYPKVKQIHYRELKFLQSDLTLNLLLPPVVTYWYNYVQALNPWTYSLLDLLCTNTHVCDFKIPLKGLATQTLQFVTPRPPLKV